MRLFLVCFLVSLKLLATADDDFNQAQAYLKAQNYEKAVEYLKRAAKKEHRGARSKLGYMYLTHTHVEKDFKKAHKFLKLAQKQDCPVAQFFLGLMYQNGHGVKPNY